MTKSEKPIINNKEKQMIKFIEDRDIKNINTATMLLNMKDSKTFKSLQDKSLISTGAVNTTRKYHIKFNELDFCSII